jgi:glycosyltransferase involved in cell wall biosynthesis
MFAGFWSVIPTFLAKMFGRRCYIIVGGTDCVSFPEFNYGSMRKSMLKKTIAYSLKNCTRILPVAEQLIEYEYTYFDALINRQGYRSFLPDVDTKTQVIYNGYELPSIEPIARKEKSFITVAGIFSSVQYELKGIDTIRELAAARPECSFTIVGIDENVSSEFNLQALENVKCIPFTDSERLQHIYALHRFYLCLSLSEGFPNALSEGMSHGCVPIGSNVSAIPFIIGETGFISGKRTLECALHVIDKAISLNDEELDNMSKAARDRIASEFSLQRRKDAFFELIG